MSRRAQIFLLVAVFVSSLIGVGIGQYYGRRSKQPVEWLSQRNGGKYPIELEIRCPRGGKSLGFIQADMNLETGKWRIIRNDPGKWGACD